MESEYYTCKFCQTQFIPKRRKVQKYCSHTCRSKDFHHKNIIKPVKYKKEDLRGGLEVNQSKTKVEQMSGPGIGNAFAGNLLADGAKAIGKKVFGNPNNEPATKSDIQEIKNLFYTRYFLIHNMDRRFDGCLPYFDMATSKLVYFKDPNYINPNDFTR